MNTSMGALNGMFFKISLKKTKVGIRCDLLRIDRNPDLHLAAQANRQLYRKQIFKYTDSFRSVHISC